MKKRGEGRALATAGDVRATKVSDGSGGEASCHGGQLAELPRVPGGRVVGNSDAVTGDEIGRVADAGAAHGIHERATDCHVEGRHGR